MSKAHTLKSIEDLRPAKKNPRRKLTNEEAAGLAASLARFGDIAGITWNKRSGRLVAGHQRVDQLKQMGAVFANGDAGPRLALDGKTYRINVVDMDETEELAANIEANNRHIAGDFNEDLAGALDMLAAQMPDEDFSVLRLGDLAEMYNPQPKDIVGSEEINEGDLGGQEHKCPRCGFVF